MKKTKEKALFSQFEETDCCNCMEKLVQSRRYGVDFPCYHEYHSRKRNNSLPSPNSLPVLSKERNTDVIIEHAESMFASNPNSKKPVQ